MKSLAIILSPKQNQVLSMRTLIGYFGSQKITFASIVKNTMIIKLSTNNLNGVNLVPIRRGQIQNETQTNSISTNGIFNDRQCRGDYVD
jgi:hypothetical protein